MKLKHTYTVSKRKIVIELSTEDFTATESKALDMLGEPVVNFQKTYTDRFTISISKTIRRQFAHVRIVLDGTDNFELANKAHQDFMDDIKEVLIAEMDKLMDTYVAQVFPDQGEIEISNYVINEPKRPVPPPPPPSSYPRPPYPYPNRY